MKNYFCYDDTQYQRDIKPFHNYIDLQAFYLSKLSGKPFEETKAYVIKNIKKDGKHPLHDPKIKFLSKLETRDRKRSICTYSEYIKLVNKHDLIMTPSWAGYIKSNKVLSLYTPYISYRSDVRSAYKKELFLAELKNDKAGIKFNDGMQSSSKIYINNISGASQAPHTINYTASLHQSLTSTCATSTALANLNNEKLIRGNRPYMTYQMTLDNLVVISMKSDYPALKKAMDEFGLVVPTVDNVMECILYSAELYWRDDEKVAKLRRYVETMTDLERCAFVYVGDMYHIYKFNPEIFKEFFLGFTNRTKDSLSLEEAEAEVKDSDSDVEILAKLICAEYLMGKTLKELKEENPAQYGEVAANMRMIKAHMERFKIFIMGFLRPPIVNPGGNIRVMKSLVRRAVLTSDTDSTIFTSQYWVKELTGYIGFEKEHYNIGYTISFLVNKTVYHQLALMSANLGFELKDLHIISMKNEYYFPIYSLTNSSKNYFAYKSVREGNIFKKMKLEKKGVELRSAKIPSSVMQYFDKWLMTTMDIIIDKQSITIDELFDIPYKTELMVKDSILNGETMYFQRGQIKDAKSYKVGENAPALQTHRLWEEIFAPKYGHAPPLPYMCLKVSVDLTTKKKLNAWLDSIKDQALKARAIEFFKKTNTTTLAVINVPALTIGKRPLPEELLTCVNVNKQLNNVTSPFYVVLEAFGYYLRTPDNTNMIYHYYGLRNNSKEKSVV